MSKRAIQQFISLFILVIFCVCPISSIASTVEYMIMSDVEVQGTIEEEGTWFSTIIDGEKSTTKFKFHNKVIYIEKNGDSEFLVMGYDDLSNEFMIVPENFYSICQLLKEEIFPFEIDLDRLDVEVELYSALNLMYHWPPNLPIAFLKNKTNVFYINSDYQIISADRSQYEDTDNKGQKKVTSLCHLRGFSLDVEGKGIIDWDRRGRPVYAAFKHTGIIGQDKCWGRCGKGCGTWSNIYSKDCATHDGCVAQLGLIHPLCNSYFTRCIDDEYAGIRKRRCNWYGY